MYVYYEIKTVKQVQFNRLYLISWEYLSKRSKARRSCVAYQWGVIVLSHQQAFIHPKSGCVNPVFFFLKIPKTQKRFNTMILINKILFTGEARDILLRQSRLAQLWQDSYAKASVLVIPTVLKIFWQDFFAKASILVIPTLLEIFWQDFYAKALVLVIPTVIEIFWQDFYTKALLFVIPTDDKGDNKSDEFAINTVKLSGFEPLPSTERLSSVSSPYMVLIIFRETANLYNFNFILLPAGFHRARFEICQPLSRCISKNTSHSSSPLPPSLNPQM